MVEATKSGNEANVEGNYDRESREEYSLRKR